jgi:hypothetical protein
MPQGAYLCKIFDILQAMMKVLNPTSTTPKRRNLLVWIIETGILILQWRKRNYLKNKMLCLHQVSS